MQRQSVILELAVTVIPCVSASIMDGNLVTAIVAVVGKVTGALFVNLPSCVDRRNFIVLGGDDLAGFHIHQTEVVKQQMRASGETVNIRMLIQAEVDIPSGVINIAHQVIIL